MENINEFKYSVLMPVYYKENPEWLRISIDSMLSQTVFPDEFVIVKDGKLTEKLDAVIAEFIDKYPDLFNIVALENNCGLGIALQVGVENCKNEFIARMDGDDYSLPDRIETQAKMFLKNPKLDVVGSNVVEFTDSIDNVISYVVLPEIQEAIYKFAKKRCPIRHPTLVYKKSAVMKAGNYKSISGEGEDYDLAVRLLQAGAQFHNLKTPCVYMRVGRDFYKRRGGVKFAKSMYELKKYFKKIGFYSGFEFLCSTIPHVIVCLMPSSFRKFVYVRLLRKNISKNKYSAEV